MALPIRSTRLPPLSGGINNTVDHMAIKKDEAFVIENCHIDENGIAFTRGGSRLLNTTALDGAVTSIIEFTIPSGNTVTRTTLVSAGLVWYTYDSTAGFTAIKTLSVATRPSVVTFLDGSGNPVCILANGTDFIKYDGSTVADVLASASDFQSASMPRFLEVYDNRLIASGCNEDPNVAYASELLDPTTWGASSYFTAEGDSERDRITGIGTIWNFLLVFKRSAVYLMTEGDPTSTTVSQTPITRQYGASSHWGIITVGDNIFFANESGIYVGYLREAVSDGLLVRRISDKIDRKYNRAKNYADFSVGYDPKNQELIWGIGTKDSTNYNLGLVLNLRLSSFGGDSPNYVWSGIFKSLGYDPYTHGLITDSGTDRLEVWRGDEDGYVYTMDEATQHKDEKRVSGTTVEYDIITRIWLGPFMPQGVQVAKRFCHVNPLLYQNHNGSTSIGWIIDTLWKDPTTDTTITYEGNIPYWNAGTVATEIQEWDTTVWAAKPMLATSIDIRRTGKFIEIVITNAGDNASDEIAYGGAEISYQYLGRRRMV